MEFMGSTAVREDEQLTRHIIRRLAQTIVADHPSSNEFSSRKMKQFFKILSAMVLATAALTGPVSALAQDTKTEVKGDAASGRAKAAMCVGCHGIPAYMASFPEIHKVPKISGQNDKYIVAALKAYKSGDRKHPSMRGLAGSLSDQDMADLGAFYSADGVVDGQVIAATPSKAPAPAVEALLNKAGCAGCHGANYAKPVDASTPKLAGQYSDYLYVALKAYKTEKNQYIGRNHPVMSTFAKQYTNNELRLMANYIGSLEGDLKSVPQRKIR